MKSLVALVLIAALGVFTIGCDTQEGHHREQDANDDNADQGRQGNGRDGDHDDRHDENHPLGHSRRCRQDDRNRKKVDRDD